MRSAPCAGFIVNIGAINNAAVLVALVLDAPQRPRNLDGLPVPEPAIRAHDVTGNIGLIMHSAHARQIDNTARTTGTNAETGQGPPAVAVAVFPQRRRFPTRRKEFIQHGQLGFKRHVLIRSFAINHLSRPPPHERPAILSPPHDEPDQSPAPCSFKS
jgi:hypothetical protein